eukprot:8480347-Prorocentrum_lima.AAC.1
MPTKDFSRVSMASDVQGRPTKVPSTKVGLAKSLEEYYSKLEMAGKLGRALEPRVIRIVLACAVDMVILTDPGLKRVWYDKVTQTSLRNPQSMLEGM